jgi:hypothetical protein
MSRESRASKVRSVPQSLTAGAQFTSDQVGVRQEVAALQNRAGVASPAHAMQDVFQARAAELEACMAVFAPAVGQTGLFLLVDVEGPVSKLVAHANAGSPNEDEHRSSATRRNTGGLAAHRPIRAADQVPDTAHSGHITLFPATMARPTTQSDPTGFTGICSGFDGRNRLASYPKVKPSGPGQVLAGLNEGKDRCARTPAIVCGDRNPPGRQPGHDLQVAHPQEDV